MFLMMKQLVTIYDSTFSRRRRIPMATTAWFWVCGSQAPPATFLPVRLHCQMPTAVRFKLLAPQKGDWYRLCWVTSIFLTILRLKKELLDNRNRTQKWDESPC